MFKKLFLMLALVSSAGLIAADDETADMVTFDDIEETKPGMIKKAFTFFKENAMVTVPTTLLATWFAFTAFSKSVYSRHGWLKTAGYQIWHPWLTTKANYHSLKSLVDGSSNKSLANAGADLLTMAAPLVADTAAPAFSDHVLAKTRTALKDGSTRANLDAFLGAVNALKENEGGKESVNKAAKDACADLIACHAKLVAKEATKADRVAAFKAFAAGK